MDKLSYHKTQIFVSSTKQSLYLSVTCSIINGTDDLMMLLFLWVSILIFMEALLYNSCVVSGNGYITFDTTVGYAHSSPWSINIAYQIQVKCLKIYKLMAPWQDINTGVVGSIFYGTSGINQIEYSL